MVEAFNLWLKVDKDELRVINKVVGMLHTSSLLCVLPPLILSHSLGSLAPPELDRRGTAREVRRRLTVSLSLLVGFCLWCSSL